MPLSPRIVEALNDVLGKAEYSISHANSDWQYNKDMPKLRLARRVVEALPKVNETLVDLREYLRSYGHSDVIEWVDEALSALREAGEVKA